MDLENRQTLDIHWTYIALYTGCTLECTRHITLHCVHWTYTGDIALYTGIHWTVHWTYGGLYTRCAHMRPRCAQLCIWPERHSPNVSSYAPDIFQLCSRCAFGLYIWLSSCAPDVFQLCSWPIYLILQMCSRCVPTVSNCALGLYRWALECLLDCTLDVY